MEEECLPRFGVVMKCGEKSQLMLKCKVILRDFHNDSVLFLGWCHIITSVWWYVNVGKYIIP